MHRFLAVCFALCLCCGSQSAMAQGLLGRPYVSGQYLLFEAGDQYKGLDVDLGHGARILANLPLVEPDCECCDWAPGLDLFGGFNGYRFQAFDNGINQLKTDTVQLGADMGVTLYVQVTDRIRPYAQFGANWNKTETKYESQFVGNFATKNDDWDVILLGGVEYDIFQCLSLRGAYGCGADGFGNNAVLGEVFYRPCDCWFGRFSCSYDENKNVLGGFGLGFTW